VKDNGIGIEPMHFDRIFKLFQRLHSRDEYEGTGLGLAVVKGIVESHRGAITVTSEPEKGAAFQVFLPCVSAPKQESFEPGGEELRGNERVLLVDDEEQIAAVEKAMLQHLGYKVTACIQSAEALQIFCAHPDDFDLVLTDQTMPAITGINLAKEVHVLRPKMPIVLCTGYSDRVDKENAQQFGIAEFLPKPLTVNILGKAIRGALQKKE
jgi:CheY-like chemotaxis protein